MGARKNPNFAERGSENTLRFQKIHYVSHFTHIHEQIDPLIDLIITDTFSIFR